MSPLRVAIFEPFGNLFGSERSMLDFLSSVPRERALPIVYCPSGAPWANELNRLAIRHFDWFDRDLHRRSSAARIVALGRFMAFLLAERIQLIHVNQAGAGPYALIAGRILGLPVILHSRWHEDPETLASWGKRLSSLSRVVCISEFQMTLIQARLGNTFDRLTVIRNPYSPSSMSAGEPLPGPAVFVCPGRLHPHKRQDLLIAAAAEYTVRHGDCIVEFLGDEAQGSGYRSHLEQLASELGVANRVRFVGVADDVLARLSRATAMVLPSEIEALGRVVFEAWDAGTVPIACASSGGPAESIGGANGGILYTEQRAMLLAQAMAQAARLSVRERISLVENGRDWMRRECLPSNHAQSLVDVWEAELSTRRASR